ncbi:MAG TPA: hypothetical protein VEQ41_00480 [Solirubrobacterales bacterium]|nr:hypothetical protein [Solirubrobacterales bacterium]
MATGGAAQAAVIPGLADSDPEMFDSALLSTSGANVERFRVIVPWDVATRGPNHPYYARRQEFESWISKFVAYKATHPAATFNVGFERINIREPNVPASGGKEATTMLGHAPTGAQYKAAFTAFLSAFGQHMSYMRIDPWNEPNYNPGNASRPLLPGGTAGVGPYLFQEDAGSCNTSNPQAETCGPRMAAYYYRWANEQCELASIACNLEAGEFAGGVSPDYIQKYKHHMGAVIRPTIWGVHNYSDVTTYQANGDSSPDELRKMVREILCVNTSNTGVALGSHSCTTSTNWGSEWRKGARIWVTATGAGYTFSCGEHPTIPACGGSSPPVYVSDTQLAHSQCDAVAWMMRWDNVDSRVDRVYHYTYMDPNFQSGSDDTGVVNTAGTVARPAYDVLRNAWTSC